MKGFKTSIFLNNDKRISFNDILDKINNYEDLLEIFLKLLN